MHYVEVKEEILYDNDLYSFSVISVHPGREKSYPQGDCGSVDSSVRGKVWGTKGGMRIGN